MMNMEKISCLNFDRKIRQIEQCAMGRARQNLHFESHSREYAWAKTSQKLGHDLELMNAYIISFAHQQINAYIQPPRSQLAQS